MRATTIGALVVTLLLASACGSPRQLTASTTPAAPASATPTPPKDVTRLTLDVGAVDSVIGRLHPGGTTFTDADRTETTPRNPAEYPGGLAEPCNRVGAIDFAGVAPAHSSYAMVPMSAPLQKSLEQVIAVYDSPVTARQVLTRVSTDVASCATRRGKPYVLVPGISTADTLRYAFQPDLSVDMPNRSLDSTEFRLFGSALVAVSSTEPAAVVTAVVDELGKRLA